MHKKKQQTVIIYVQSPEIYEDCSEANASYFIMLAQERKKKKL